MTYWALNAFFLGAVAIIAMAALVSHRAPRWLAVLIAVGILLVFTAIFDNVLIGLGFVGYNRALISGMFIGRAPLEDFAYTVAAVVLLPSLWTLLDRKPRRA
jgi:lycopene cyclase domain-containing protein